MTSVSKENVFEYEKYAEYIDYRIDLLCLAAEYVYNDIRNDAYCDTLGDTVEERNADDAEIRGDSFGERIFGQLYLRDRAEHQKSHKHKSRSGGK